VLDTVCPAKDTISGTSRHVKHFKKAVAACDLPKETAPYDLRHAKGTHRVEASGGNLNGVAFRLGHKLVTTTNKYVHSSQRSAESVLSALECRREDGGKRGGNSRAQAGVMG
jgi:site-specific recombinase XerD